MSREALDPKLQASHSGVGACGAPRVGRGRGRGLTREEEEEERRGGREEDLVVAGAGGGFSPVGEVFVSLEKGGGHLREDAAGRARELPTAPAPSPRPRACLAASAWSGPPSRRRDSVGRWWFGRAPHRAWRCIVAPGTIRGRLGAQPRIAGPRSGGRRPTPQPLDFFLFPSFFVVAANLGFLSSLFPSFLSPPFFSFAAGGVGKRGSS